jgi:hypothetical protein
MELELEPSVGYQCRYRCEITRCNQDISSSGGGRLPVTLASLFASHALNVNLERPG